MTTSLLEAPKGTVQPSGKQYFLSNGAFSAPRRMFRHTYKRGDATVSSLRLEKVAVFRSGTFRDSWGDQSTWTQMHMAAMVQNYSYLAGNGTFADVPVRKGHGSFLGDPMDSLIGYVTGMSTEEAVSPVDGKSYHYLFADYEILDADAQDKIESGLWRNRSAEIGTFTTNDEAEYTPTFMGFAYVDIPAVEGLNGTFSKNREFAIATPKENAVAEKDDTKGPDAPPVPAPSAGPSNEPVNPDPTTPAPDPDLGNETVAEGVEAIAAPVGAEGSAPASAVFPPTIPEAEPIEELTHEEPGVIVQPKRTGDKTNGTQDNTTLTEVTELQPGVIFAKAAADGIVIDGKKYTTAQAASLINQYQAANVAAFAAEKAATVESLAKANMIMASKVDKTLEYVRGMNRAQFSAWVELQSDIPLFSAHTGGNPAQAAQASPEQQDYEVNIAILQQYKNQNKSDAVIKANPVYAKAQAQAEKLGVTFPF